MHSRTQTSAMPERVEALLARHATLSRQIEMEMKSPAHDQFRVKDLKRKKLRVKDEIEGIQG